MPELSFQFLDDDSVDLLDADESARMAYIDLLCRLHDLLIPLRNQPEPARFSSKDNLDELNHLIHAFSSGREIGQIARANVAVAEALHSRLAGLEVKTVKYLPVVAAVEKFLSDLLEQYNVVRVSRSGKPRKPLSQPA